MKHLKNGVRLTVKRVGSPTPFLKKPSPPVPPQQKLLIKGGHRLQPGRIYMQTMTAFVVFLR
jgi:hypothetical protein